MPEFESSGSVPAEAPRVLPLPPRPARNSIEAIFAASDYRCSGFDYLRIVLAVGVILWHGSIVSYGPVFDKSLHQTAIGTIARTILPMFFALSGFLVAGSLFRSGSLVTYASNRALRIFPALVVEVLLSAVVLGGILTTLPLGDYLTSGQFVRYLGNVFGIVYVFLPGVFEDNPIDWVNISLWTVPYELECYIALLVVAATGLIRRPLLFLLALVAVQVALPLYDFYGRNEIAGINRVPPRTLVLCFLAGVGFYVFRDRVPVGRVAGAVALVVAVLMVHSGTLVYFIPLPIAYATVVIGLMDPPRLPVIFGGDYSYGLYLYAFPFQQLQAHLFPDHRDWTANMAFALPCAALFAVFSWHTIERPILMRRKRIVAGIGETWSGLKGRFRRA